MDLVHGLLQARMLEWVAFPFFRGSSQPGIEPRSPALQADSLSVEPPGLPDSNVFWACYLDCQGPVLVTLEYHCQVVFHWERVTSYSTRRVWEWGNQRDSSLNLDTHTHTHTSTGIWCKLYFLFLSPFSPCHVKDWTRWSPGLFQLTFHKYLKPFFLPGAKVSITIKSQDLLQSVEFLLISIWGMIYALIFPITSFW